jgi:hypothetical protein
MRLTFLIWRQSCVKQIYKGTTQRGATQEIEFANNGFRPTYGGQVIRNESVGEDPRLPEKDTRLSDLIAAKCWLNLL